MTMTQAANYDQLGIVIYQGDCRMIMGLMEPNSLDAIVCDPPYGLEFMGKTWDKLSGAGFSRPGIGQRNIKWPSFGGAPFGGANPSCQICGGRLRGKKRCVCVEPDWHVKGASFGTNGFRRQDNPADVGRNDVFGRMTQHAPEYRAGQEMQDWHRAWAVEALRIAKPGAYLLAFGGTRTYHRLTCAIEDAGWEIRDCLMFVYGSGFPKSLNVGKAIDKAAGAEREVVNTGRPVKRTIPGADQDKTGSWIKDNGREFVPTDTAPATDDAKQWDGWGTGLKPAYEPIIIARKPLEGTVAQNVLKWGTGAMNIDGCRIDSEPRVISNYKSTGPQGCITHTGVAGHSGRAHDNRVEISGRWPANLIHDGSEEVVGAFPDAPGQIADLKDDPEGRKTKGIYGAMKRSGEPSANSANEGTVGFKMKPGARRLDEVSAARFFYTAKASASDRGHEEWDALPLFNEPAGEFRNTHPTVKPLALMRYLLTLVSRDGSMVLDPFVGSGSTLVAAKQLGRKAIGIDLHQSYLDIAIRRLEKL